MQAKSALEPPYRGSCLCGALRFEVDEIQARMAHCHCSMCRKFHGAAFSTYGEALNQHFRWLSNTNQLVTYTSENGSKRQFCRQCGSSLGFIHSDSDGSVVEFALGALDCDIPIKPDAHLFTENQVCWHSILDELPQHKRDRDS